MPATQGMEYAVVAGEVSLAQGSDVHLNEQRELALSGIGTRVGATGCAVCARTLSIQTAQASIAPSRSRAMRIAAEIKSGIGSRSAAAAVRAERLI